MNESLNSTHDISDATADSQSVPKPLFYAKNMTVETEVDAVTLSTIRLCIARGLTAKPAKRLEMDMQALLRLKLREGANPCTPVLVYGSAADAARAEHAWGSCIGSDVDRVTAVLACGVLPMIAYPSILAMALDAGDDSVVDIIAEESKHQVSVSSMLLRAVGAPVQTLKPEPLRRPERVMLLKALHAHQAALQTASSSESVQDSGAHGNVLDELNTEDDAKPAISTSSPTARPHASAARERSAQEEEQQQTVPATPWQAKPQAPPSEEEGPAPVPQHAEPEAPPAVEGNASEATPSPAASAVPPAVTCAELTLPVVEAAAPTAEVQKPQPVASEAQPIVATVREIAQAGAGVATVPPPPVPAPEATLVSKRSGVVVPPLSLPQHPVSSTVRPEVQQPPTSDSTSTSHSSPAHSAPLTTVSTAAESPVKVATSTEKVKPVITVPDSPVQPSPVQSKPLASSGDKAAEPNVPAPSPAPAPVPAQPSPQKEKEVVAARAQPQPIPETAPSNNKCCCVM